MATKPQMFPKIVEEWNVDDDDFPETKMEEAVTTSVSPTDEDSSKKPNQNKNKPSIAPAPLSSLFRFASTQDLIVLGLGFFFCILSSITMPAINIIFGSVIDSIAEPINVQELVNTSVRGMIGLGIYGFITFAVSFWLCGKAAACVANGYRMRYVEALLQQDMSFFDNAEPGSLTLMLSDSAMTIQMGLSDKFAQGVQGVFQFLFGFAIAFSFGPILSLVLMACVPFLCAVTVAMFMWGSEDGIFGKEAYEQAATIANETISNIQTVISLNAEPMMSKRYDSKLGESEKAAIRQGTRNAFLTGLLFFVIFCMYGFGFWFGARLIAKSIDSAIEAHPPPDGLLDDTESPYRPIIDLACGQYSDNAEALAVCACGLPWTTIVEDLDVNTDEFPLPNCGCGYEETSQGVTSVLMGCLSGGRVMMVFFSILIGGFSLSQVGPGIKALADARIAAAKILAVIDRKPTIGDDEKSKRLDKANVQGELTFENLHFTYETSKYTAHKDDDEFDVEKVSKLVFGGCNLTIKAGETVALVGESGCGKSTIAKLVSRFYDPTEGRILLDGTDLRNINVQDLRSCIGIVSQEPLLFDTTIEENIRYGKPGATLEDIQQAAEKANAHEFISALPDGYKTLVGARGGKLSGGQKQRVAIARAILRDPPILILDEATSALDSKSERIVQAALDNLIQQGDSSGIARSRTIIVIAHRLSTVRNADRIVVLGSPEGTSTVMTGSIILEEGSHDALLEKENGFYRALVGAGQSSGGGLGLIDDQVGRQSGVSETRSKETGTGTPSLGSEPLKGEEGEADEENESKFGLASFFGKKETKEAAKEAEEKKILADRKARVWTYTRPELGFIGFGATASAIKGSIMPLLSIFFTRMIVVWFDSDTSEMMRRSAQYSFFFYGIALLYMITEAVQKGVFEMVGERLTKRMRGDLFRAILRKDVTWFEDEENSAGVLSSRLSTDVKLVRLVAGQSVASTLESCSSLLTGTIIAAVASWQVFLVMIALVPLLAIAEALQFTAMQSSEGKIREQLSDSTSKLHEMISGIREVQAFSLQRVGIDNIEKRIKDTIIPVSSRAAIAKGITMGVINAAQFFVYALAFWAGGKLISSGAVEFDDFLQALWAMAFAGSGLGQAALFAGDAAKAAAAVTAVFKTLDYIPKIDSEPWENNGVADKDTLEPKVRQISNKTLEDGQGELSQVNFAYPTRKGAKIFDQIDLTIPSGRVVALVGASGSGKSTVVQLLLRFYDPISYKEGVDGDDLIDVVVDDGKPKTTDGVVKLDGLDIREEDLRWLRSNMGYVGQEPVLFNDTVYNNIAMGKQGCTRAEVEAAAKSANAYDFILRLEDGFDTMVGLGGGKVSGGQKQRIAIARALVSNPKILILDEATSALDNESEKIVQESLDSLMKESAGSRTTIVIAHRLSTIRGADSICVLENQGDGSRVVEMGSHDELIEKGEKYAALVQAYESS